MKPFLTVPNYESIHMTYKPADITDFLGTEPPAGSAAFNDITGGNLNDSDGLNMSLDEEVWALNSERESKEKEKEVGKLGVSCKRRPVSLGYHARGPVSLGYHAKGNRNTFHCLELFHSLLGRQKAVCTEL